MNETFDRSLEAPVLQNIRQITFSSMGFVKAGEAYFSPDSTKVIFQAVPQEQEHYQIYVMDLETLTPRMVSTGKGACTCAFFKPPDGAKIIFASSHSDPEPSLTSDVPGYKRDKYSWAFTPYMNVYEANVDGSELKALTTGPDYSAECSYNSDGTEIVFASNRSFSVNNGNSGNVSTDGSTCSRGLNLFIMDADGSNVRQITHSENVYCGGPFFSPDNTKVVYRADPDRRHYLQIYIINTDGSNRKQLTHDLDVVNWAPFFHPSGSAIGYTTSVHGHQHYEIYLLDIETQKTRRVTHNETFDGLPSFNRDGTKMVWTSKRGDESACHLFIADFQLPAKENFSHPN